MHTSRPRATLLALLSLLMLGCASDAPSSPAQQSPSITNTTANSSQANPTNTNSAPSSTSSPATPVTSASVTPTSSPSASSSTTTSTSTPDPGSDTIVSGEIGSSSPESAGASEAGTASIASGSSSSERSAPGAATSEPSDGATSSAGCGKSGRPNGGKVYVAGEYWLTFPSDYDGDKPFPLLFGFHGCGDGNRGDGTRTEYTDLTTNNVLGQEYVVAAPVSSDGGGCWNYDTDVVRAKQLYDDIVSNYCVDTGRAFATGHSSGAQFVVQLYQGNHSADASHFNFKGVAPVAASSYNHSAPVAVMYIQNQNDTVRAGSGKDVVDDFVAANQCGNTSAAYSGVEGCQSGGTQVAPGCVQYDSCSVPTIWCSHNDPQYSDTGHGVPCFAATAMDHFFKSL
jgi:polyhydroxybutyrate depolymerase